MDYIIATMNNGKQQEVYHWCEKINDNDRLIVFEMDNVSWDISPLNSLPKQDNIIALTVNDFPFKSFCIQIQHQLIDAKVPKNLPLKYNVCMLNRRPAPIRVLFMKNAEILPNFIGSMYAHERIERNCPDVKTIRFVEGLVCVNDRYYLHPDDDMSRHFNILEKRLTETPTEQTRNNIGLKYKKEFEDTIIPPLEWFESHVDLFHEGDQKFSEKLSKNFIHRKPFLYLGVSQRESLKQYGFEDYFHCNSWFTDVFDFTAELCLDIGMLEDYDIDNKINHNYERALEVYNQYGDFANFILNVELNGPFITEKTELIDEYIEMLGTISSIY